MSAIFIGTHHRLFATEEMSIGDYRCHALRGAACEDEFTNRHELMFVRRGVFTARIGNEEFLLTPAHTLVLRPGTPYRIDHPTYDGDECTVFALSDAAFDQVASVAHCAFDRPRAISGTRAFLLHQQLYRTLMRGDAEALLAEESALRVIDAFSDAAADRRHASRMSRRTRRAVIAAEELIAVHYIQTLPLQTIADMVGLSRFHLCRYFRALTGTSIHQFQTTLRLREALRRLEDGASDLAALALDLGFADHSHFTDAFQQQFGIAPSRFRALSRRARASD